MTLTLVATIVLALGIGIGSGYAVIVGVFSAMNHNRREKSAAPALVPSAGSGD